MKIVYRFLFGLHLFVGVGALAGGWAAISNPQAPLGAPVEMLKNSPFSDFLIPGILLFAVIGLGNLVAALTFWLKLKLQPYASGFVSCALIIWIIVQCIMIRSIHPLHIIFFSIGVVQGILAAVSIFKQRLFPVKEIISCYKGIKKDM
jgi:hypothetical protein